MDVINEGEQCYQGSYYLISLKLHFEVAFY